MKLGTPPQDFAHAGLIIAWGANVHGNNVHLWPFIEEARRKGEITGDRSLPDEDCPRWQMSIWPSTPEQTGLWRWG